MTVQRRLLVSLVWAAVSVGGASGAQAAGYFGGPVGATALGRGGAFVARADDLSAAFYNPAGLAKAPGWLRLQLENKAAYSSLTFSRDPTRDGRSESAPLVDFETSDNARKWRTLGPLVGLQSDFGLRNLTFALVSFTPSGAANTEFPQDGAQKYLLVKRDVVVINTSLSAAWRARPNLAFGVSLQAISVPSIYYQLVIDNAPGAGVDVYNPVSSALDMLTTIRASDPLTWNLTAGLWARPEPGLEVGLSAQVLPANVEARGTLHVAPIDPAALAVLAAQDPPIPPESAVALTRDGAPADDIRLKLPLPVVVRAGTRFVDRRADGSERFDIELDATYETWSRVDAFTLNGNRLQATFAGLSSDPIPLDVIAVQKHWQDALTLALGTDVSPRDLPVVLRGGVYYETAVTPKAYAHVDFPGGAHVGVTAGLSLPLGPASVHLAYERRQMLTFHTSESEGRVLQVKPNLGDNPSPAASPPVVNAGRYAFASHNLALGVRWGW